MGSENGKTGLYPETLKVHYQKPGGVNSQEIFGFFPDLP